MTWIFQNKNFTADMIGDNFGFVYLITNLLTGQMYVGRKYFGTIRRKEVKGQKKRKVIRKQSNWQDYWGSCKPLLAEIEKIGSKNFRREILSLHKTKGQVNYTETKEQFIRDVLYAKLPSGTKAYYNDNILGRYFPPKESHKVK